MKNKSFFINFNNLPIEVTKKEVKNISIRIIPPHGTIRMSIPLFISNDKIISFLESKREWIINSRNRVITKAKNEPKLDFNQSQDFINSFPPILEKWENKMGLKASKVKLQVMKSCWGSCRYQTKAISFNLKLATKPLECTEYVIIHELAHIVHPNHSQEFWKLVGKYCPDYKRIRALLKS